MRGDARTRFCDHCNLHVHNLSEMNSDEARELIENRGGRTCVCYSSTADGKVHTLDYRPASPRFRSARLWIGAGSLVAVVAWVIRLASWNKPAPPAPLLGKVMGDVASPRPAPAQVQGEISSG
jgi:hypothetical protein